MLDNRLPRTSILTVLFLLFFTVTCWAGNLSLIEKRLKELDALNKQAIKQAIIIPENGVIDAILKIPSGNNIKGLAVQKLTISTYEPDSPFSIQVSASPQHERILDVAKQLRKAGLPAFISTPFLHKGKTWWRIYIGSYQTKAAARKANEKLEQKSFPKGFVLNLPYAIQVGAELKEKNVSLLEQELQSLGYLSYRIQGKKKWYTKILLGAFRTELEAKIAAASLQGISKKTSIIQR